VRQRGGADTRKPLRRIHRMDLPNPKRAHSDARSTVGRRADDTTTRRRPLRSPGRPPIQYSLRLGTTIPIPKTERQTRELVGLSPTSSETAAAYFAEAPKDEVQTANTLVDYLEPAQNSATAVYRTKKRSCAPKPWDCVRGGNHLVLSRQRAGIGSRRRPLNPCWGNAKNLIAINEKRVTPCLWTG
jgi:hypothetical protein